MISQTDIDKLAELSRIHITEEEKAVLASEIDAILGYVSVVKDIAVHAPDTAHIHINVMREDTVTCEPGAYTDVLLNAAPSSEDGYVTVKKILS